MRLERDSWQELPSVAELSVLARQNQQIVLSVPEGGDKEAQKALIAELQLALAAHRVFNAGASEGRERVTMLSVLSRTDIRKHLTRFHRAAWAYRQLANELMPRLFEKLGLPRDAPHWDTHSQEGSLDKSWEYFFHGQHCAIYSTKTGECVEASLDFGGEFGVLDPDFLGRFIQKAPDFEDIASLIKDNFHDGCQILDVLKDEGLLEKIQFRDREGFVALHLSEERMMRSGEENQT